MKKINSFKRAVLLMSALLMTSGLFATNDFNAWEFKAGSSGIGANNGLEFVSNSITVEFWINMADASLIENTNIIETWHDPNGININIRKNSANDNALEMRVFAKDRSATPQPFSLFIPASYYVGKWGHIAFVISEADNKAFVYVNGELLGEVVASGGYYGNYRANDSFRNVNLAGKFYENPALVDTKLADVRVWSVARTAEEIKANYNKNLIGTHEDNPGLYLNYRFGALVRPFLNDANLTDDLRNRGWANPNVGNWNELHAVETLSAYPRNLAIASETLSWDTTDGAWEVSIFKKSDDSQVYTGSVAANSIILNVLEELENETTYYAKVRTLNNGFYSGMVTSDDFTVTKKGTSLDEVTQGATFYVSNGSLFVNAEKAQTLNIYTVAGQLVRSVDIVAGENVVSGLAKGFYLANNQKIIIR